MTLQDDSLPHNSKVKSHFKFIIQDESKSVPGTRDNVHVHPPMRDR